MRIRSLALTTGLLATGLAPLALAAPATAAPAKYGDDFNGDGYRDYAVFGGSPDGTSNGGVKVTFGTADGPGTKTQFIDQSSPGVPGTDEENDAFGEIRAAADFNNDGYGDLAVSATGEEEGGRKYQGSVTILWGSKNGLSGGLRIPPKDAAAGGRMGRDLATGDFNGDGEQDLAVVNNGKAYVYRGPIDKSGVHGSVTTLDKEGSDFSATSLIAGKVTGDKKTDLVIIGDVVSGSDIGSEAWFIKGGEAKLYPGKSVQLEAPNEPGHTERGGDGVIADFDKDGYGDIAIGTQVHKNYTGRVTIWYGGSSAPSTRTARFTQNSSGIKGTAESGDAFGRAVAAGDVNGDGYQDLAVGSEGEVINGARFAGGVHVLYGRASGLTGTGSQWFARNVAGVPGDVNEFDYFGGTVRLRDGNGDGYADLYVAGQEGHVRLPGSKSGITTTGATTVDWTTVAGISQ
ncbi:FG-GAP and VCBS repeat-containing protein [Streptomyces acidicola]|uniref:Integrin-like protein n=1 Tax=Streptomyces acidicola TaxID=2596892 RepID=A0A5N8X285_9ACTN|nr:FG-GAP and VCBS repeat-containing protein [Streptomyces acidicola]MPY53693.1 hypothetical protein [Streptomyces acidicola]